MVLHQPPHQMALGQIAGDAREAAPAVGAFQQVGFVVAVLVVVEGHVHGICIEQIRADVVHEGGVRNTRQVAYFGAAPGFAAICGALDDAVVGADVQPVLIERRLPHGADGVVLRHRIQIPGGLNRPLAPHHRQAFAELVAGEITRQRAPAVAAIV